MNLRKTHLAAAVGAALLVGGTAVQAQNLAVQLYGQVNRALMHVDNDTANKWFLVDNQMSSTRFGIQGTAQIAPGLRAGARIESEMRSNRSNEVNFVSPTNGSGQSFTERWLDASLEGSWGRMNLGQGSGAADDASTIDLSGTGQVQGATLADHGGAVPFTTSTGVASGATPVNSLDNLDFESRYDRVMYTTPVMGGARVQVGYGQKDNNGEAFEASVWWSGRAAGELQFAIGYSTVNLNGTTGTAVPAAACATCDDRTTMGGSISWLHTSGFNITWQYTTRELDSVAGGRDATHMMIKPGYKWGEHAVSFAYVMTEDQFAAGDEGKAMSFAYVWNPIRWAEIYAAYHMFSLDRTAPNVAVNDINVLVVGTRLRF